MKKFIAVILALTLLACLFAGCAKDESAKTLKVGKYSGKNEFYFYVVGNFELHNN